MMTGEIYDSITLAWGDTEVPDGLWKFFDRLDKTIKVANGMSFKSGEEICLRSTQVASLIVLLWKMGVINDTQA